jgi:hypothetical protein
MPPVVTMGGMMLCTMGMAPSSIVVLPANKVMAPVPVANIVDQKTGAEIVPFGMCISPSNPTVAAATAAALGVLTPMPCVPTPPAPMIPGASPTEMVGNMPTTDMTCTIVCAFAGMISFTSPGQFKVMLK